MSIGLDLGTTQFRSLRCVGDELVGRQCRAVYIVLSDTAGHRRLLEQAGSHFATCGDDLVLFGEAALEWSDMLNLPLVPLLRGGRIPGSDPVARQIVALMVDAVLPPANRLGDVCCLAVPGGFSRSHTDLPYDVRFLQQLVALRGYQPKLISAGMAVVLAELADASFSGLGISLGAADCQFGVIHCGRELAQCSVPSPLIELAAAPSSTAVPRDGRSLTAEERASLATWDQSLLKLLMEVFVEARGQLTREGSIGWLSQPAHIACTGGITTLDGFSRLFAQAWRESDWPLKVGHIRVASDPIFSVARGCLIQARLDGDEIQHRAA